MLNWSHILGHEEEQLDWTESSRAAEFVGLDGYMLHTCFKLSAAALMMMTGAFQESPKWRFRQFFFCAKNSRGGVEEHVAQIDRPTLDAN